MIVALLHSSLISYLTTTVPSVDSVKGPKKGRWVDFHFQPPQIYSGKSICVAFFSQILQNPHFLKLCFTKEKAVVRK